MPEMSKSTGHVVSIDADAITDEATGELLTLIVDNARSFRERLPDLFAAFLEAAAFVNWRRIKSGEAPVLVLAFDA